MEIKIVNENEIRLPDNIEINYYELDREISDSLKKYDDADHRIDSKDLYNAAKDDRAKLNKLITAISDERKMLKKRLLAPMENPDGNNQSFNTKIENLISKIDIVKSNIDLQIKEYETEVKNERKAEVVKIATAKLDELMHSSSKDEYCRCGSFMNRFFNERIDSKKDSWLNASTSKSAIEDEIERKFSECADAVNNSIMYMKSMNLQLDDFAMAKMWEVLECTYNINDVMVFVNKYNYDKDLKAKIEERKRSNVIEEPVRKRESVAEKNDIYSCTIKFTGKLHAFEELKQYLAINDNLSYETVSEMVVVK